MRRFQQGARLRRTVKYGVRSRNAAERMQRARMPGYLRDAALAYRPNSSPRMYSFALLTAVAASPEPAVMRRTLPGYVTMSPAAKTPGRLVDMSGRTAIPLPTMVSPQSRERLDVREHPDRQDDRVDLHRLLEPAALVPDHRPGHLLVASTSFSVKYGYFTRTWEERRRWDHRLVGVPLVHPVAKGHLGGDPVEGERPVHRRCSPADDQDLFPPERFERGRK